MNRIFKSKQSDTKGSEAPVSKKKNHKNRFRSITVGFRMTPKEAQALDDLVASSGLSKQDYITQAVLNHKVNYRGSMKMMYGIQDKLDQLIMQLKSNRGRAKLAKEDLDYIAKIITLYEQMNNKKSPQHED